MFVYRIGPVKDNQDGSQNGHPLFIAGLYAWPFVEVLILFDMFQGHF